MQTMCIAFIRNFQFLILTFSSRFMIIIIIFFFMALYIRSSCNVSTRRYKIKINKLFFIKKFKTVIIMSHYYIHSLSARLFGDCETVIIRN